MSEHVRGRGAVNRALLAIRLRMRSIVRAVLSDGVMDGKVSVNERAYTVGKGNDATLCLCAIDTAVAVDHQPVVLPVNVFAGKSGKLGDSQAGIKQRPENETLLMCLTC